MLLALRSRPASSQVEPSALRLLAKEAMVDIAHLLRPGHLQQLANILKDGQASVWLLRATRRRFC